MITESSVDAQYNAIFNTRDAINQDNPKNLPLGFHYIATSTGKVLGFYCPRCRLQIIGAPEVVKHCGRESRLPEGRLAKLISRLKTIRYNRTLSRWDRR